MALTNFAWKTLSAAGPLDFRTFRVSSVEYLPCMVLARICARLKGIISHLSRCLIYRHPVSIYVPLDTRRDYLFIDDCARQIAASLSRTMSERPRAVLKIFASGQSTSLAQIVGVFFRMAKHRPLIVSRQAQRTQSISVKFRSDVWRDLGGLRKTDLAAGIHLLHEHQLGLFQRGLLPPPP